MSTPYKLYIDGTWAETENGNTEAITNPATGEAIAEVPYGGRAEARAALEAAATALPEWRGLTAWERARLLYRVADLIRDRSEEIARVLTLEQGKPLAEARGEVNGSARFFEWFAEEGKRAYGRIVPPSDTAKRHWVIKQPIGVVAAIAPWNFPVSLMARKLAPALAAGCTIVGRPASQTPLSTMLLFGCLHDAGIPAGAANLVNGSAREIAGVFMEHEACRKITFTGSTEVGKLLMEQAADGMKKLSLELGGHAPLIVFPDVDVADAARTVVDGKFRNNGQSCIAPTRIYVHRDVFEPVCERVVAETEALTVGNGLDAGVTVGPLFEQKQLESIENFVADASEKGATVLTGGHRLTDGDFANGFFYAPTVLSDINATMRLTCEETFGPILPLIPFDTTDEVLTKANDSVYGLAAYILTHEYETVVRVTEGLEFGVIGVNDVVPTVPQAPFGGLKESGMGREGGIEGLEAYMETKYISLKV